MALKITKRIAFWKINEFQRQVIVLIFVPLILVCLGLSYYIISTHREMMRAILYASEPMSVHLIDQWGGLILTGVWILFFLVMIWAFRTSGRLLGGMERILREVDHVVAGSAKNNIRPRKGEKLAEELLERINMLIAKS